MERLPGDPFILLRSYFVVLTLGVLGGSLIPPFRQRLYSYGARQTTMAPKEAKGRASVTVDRGSSIFDYLSLIPEVPHAWFIHFYALSILSSLFWGYQIFGHGGIVSNYLPNITFDHDRRSMTYGQILLTWSLMALQGCRRFYECLTLTKPTSSKMGLPHYIMGMAYYAGVGIAVWMEGLQTLVEARPSEETFPKPHALKTLFGLLLFVVASIAQNTSHRQLASLKKYTLPQHPLFKLVLCPHYTSECLLYLALSIIAAPAGDILNKTLLTVVLFTFVNLAITADGTRDWYVQKFGAAAASRKRMIPYIF